MRTNPTGLRLVHLGRVRPGAAFSALFVLYLLLLGTWALATPLGQTPDEWAHVFRAGGVVDGQVMIAAPGPIDAHVGDPVRISRKLAERNIDTRCFRFRPTVAVSCAKPSNGSAEPVFVATTAGRYPPFYYALVGWPLRFGSGDTSLYGMRLITALLSALFLASGATAALRLRAGLAFTGFVVAVTPMVAYLAAMINPNGLEIAAASSLWANLLLWLESASPPGRRAGRIGAAVAASTMVLCRTISIVWVAVAVASTVVLVRRHWVRSELSGRRAVRPVAAVLIATIVSGVWALDSREFQIAPIVSPRPRPNHSLWTSMTRAYHVLPHWLHEAIADLGWLDTPVSQATYRAYYAAIIVLAVAALLGASGGRWREGLAALLAVTLTTMVTIYLAAANANSLKLSFWQGRYSLPMAVGIPILLGFAAGTWRRASWLAGLFALAAVMSATVVQANSFLKFFRRNSVGVSRPLDLYGGWQPPLGVLPLTVVLIAASGLLGGLAVWRAASSEDPSGIAHTDLGPDAPRRFTGRRGPHTDDRVGVDALGRGASP